MTLNTTVVDTDCLNCSSSYHGSAFQILDFPKNLAFPIYGILCPIIAILTLVSNILVVCVFMKRRMRSVTTVFLVGLAVSDTLGAFLWSCVHLFFYGIRQKEYTEPIEYPLCVFHDFALYLAVILHSTSVWLTMTLGIQRCIIVVFPFKGPRIWTMKNSIIMTTMSYLVGVFFFIPLFFMKHYTESELVNGSKVCMERYAEWFESDLSTYMSIYHVLRSVFVQLLPCLSMMVSTAVLAHKLRNEKIFQRGMSKIGKGQKKDYQHRHRTTLMVVIIMLIFLIVEVPNGIVFGIKIYDTDNSIMPTSIDYPFAILHNFILLLSYHCNFWIYVGLSARFRRTLKDMLLGSRVKRTFERVMSMSRTDSFSSRQGYPLSTIKHRHMNGNGATSVVKYSTVDCD